MAYDPNEPRNKDGEWTVAGNSARKAAGLGTAEDVLRDVRNKLQEVSSLNDMKILESEIQNNPDFVIGLYGKRNGLEAYSFSQAYNPLKVEYLYEDGVSTGKALYSNLHKVLKIKIWDVKGHMLEG